MSRPVTISSAVTFYPASYSDNTFGSSYYQNLDNGLNPHDGSNSYARFRMYSTNYHIYYDFSVNGIPNGATINSVTCQVKAYVQNASYYPSVQLYANTTAKGSATNITSNSTSNVVSLTTGTWALSELQNARLYIKTVTTNTRQNRYFYFYGATLTVNYSINGIEYEVSVSNSSNDVIVNPSAAQYIVQGGSHEINFTGISGLDTVEITDNGNDIEQNLVYSSSKSYTESLVPSSYESTNGTVTNGNNGCTSANSDSYSQLRLNGSNLYMIYAFDVSSIPTNATIDSVSCVVRGNKQGSSSTASAQLYNNSTAKGSSVSFTNTASNLTINGGSWDRNELSNIKLRLTGNYTNNNTYYLTFYGADLTISYTIAEDSYTYTIPSISADHTIAVSESQSYICTSMSSHDTATISPATLKVYEGKNAIFTINGDTNELVLKDNGIDVTNLISNGTYTITNVHEIHSLTLENKAVDRDWIKIQNQFKGVKKIFKKIYGQWVEVNKTAFDTYVSSNIVFYGGNIEVTNLGVVEKSSTEISISINDNALTTGTYKLVYENENKEPIPNVDKITEFTV